MGWPRKKDLGDPFEARSRELADQIRLLEKQIQNLANKAPAPGTNPGRLPPAKASAAPKTPLTSPAVAAQVLPPAPVPRARAASPTHLDARINPLGIRKFDLASLWNRMQQHFRGPNANNPRMVQYLAAGSVHGLRPLRYEKRVARNRFIGLFVLLMLILFGLARVYLPHG